MTEEKKSFWGRLKDQLVEEGKKGALKSKAIKLEYLGGHPRIKKGTVSVAPSPEPNSLYINNSEILVKKMEWDEKGKRSAGSAAAGAIIGGVLTGGLGAIAGGAIGGRKKDDSLAVVTYTEGASEVEQTVYFRCDQGEYQKLSALL